ncbi:hypothetical protein N7467_001065 [Penicillium canescens]|nr:hypothetical protein N7467_001065 [Penicillium canescens]
MAPIQRAGKTAPRLVHDIQLYDPAHVPDTGRNLLAQVPPVYSYPEPWQGLPGFISPKACKHKYVLKADQTFLAQAEHRKRPGTSSKIAAVCSECRCHLQVVVNYTNGMNSFNQNKEGHMHHLVYKSGRQKNGMSMPERTDKGQVAETFHYQCSYISCSAMVSLRILSPILTPELVRLMVDPDLLHERAEQALAAYPESMEGMGDPQPISVLDNLRLYISNALRNAQRGKPISAVNKRFMHSFGVEGAPCKGLLEFLEFTYNKETGAWTPPQPNVNADKPYQDPLCTFLDDVAHELLSLINHRPPSVQRGSQFPALPPSAVTQIYSALEAQNYPKAMRVEDFEMPPAPFYEDLGAVEDMSASAIVEAFERQISVDPGRYPLYLSALKSIGSLRVASSAGEDWAIIDGAVQRAYADGKYTVEDLDQAYRYFGLRLNDPNLTDESIIGKFLAFLGSTNRETEARQQLWRIGDSRASESIISASEDRISTVEQANVFLGVEDQTPDDFVMTMYTAKVNDNPLNKELANRAVALIAASRKSVALNHFINTGEALASEMDVGDAYRLLQIPDRTADAGAIMAAYTICVDENPGQIEKYNEALAIIAKQTDNATLRSMAGISPEQDYNVSEWPVGLQNIGNTCYLNSLLQFYFSIRPFREMVLDYEMYQMDLNDNETMAKKQVGSRKVMKNEVERSQRFLNELRILFQSMITSSRNSVTPGQELARLTLISPSNEAAIRRRSTISASRNQILGEIGGAPVLGPLGPPVSPPMDNAGQPATDAANSAPVKESATSDMDSDLTMVSGNDPDVPVSSVEDKENDPPQLDKTEVATDEDMKLEGRISVPNRPEPSSVPPPVPPRPVPEVDREKQLQEEVEIGAQQDVTEVINNVLFQSQCAIKPRGIGSDGEQLDQIKDLFYGQTRSYISAENGMRSKEERWCDIKVDVAHGSRDIYDAIDGAFDVQKISVGNSVAEQFGSISQLPPILQVQVQRVQFDPVKKSSFKSTNHLELLETIYMDRYMDTKNTEFVNRRNKAWEWKATLKTLEARREELLKQPDFDDGIDMAELFRKTGDTISNLRESDSDSGPDSLASMLSPQLSDSVNFLSEAAQAELESIDQELKDTRTMISTQFSDYQKLPYRLYAVFVHHGSVSFGHYYIYIYDFRRGIWRKYNDEYVTEVYNVNEIFENDSTNNPPTPYFLVYVNDTIKDRLADPVCRDVTESMPDMTEQETPAFMEDTRAASPTDVDMDPQFYDTTAPRGTPDSTAVDATAVNPLKRKSVDAEGKTLPA